MASHIKVFLAQIRKILKQKGWNTAQLAVALKIDRRRMRNLLAGKEPMTMEMFFTIVEEMKLTPEELGFAGMDTALLEEAPAPVIEGGDDVLSDESNQVVELFKLGFKLGVDMYFVADTKKIKGAGIPSTVLSRFPTSIPIKLDAAYHLFNKPVYHEDGLQLELSFEGIATCFFPWDSVLQVSFTPEHFEPAPKPKKPDPEKLRGPALRLIKS